MVAGNDGSYLLKYILYLLSTLHCTLSWRHEFILLTHLHFASLEAISCRNADRWMTGTLMLIDPTSVRSLSRLFKIRLCDATPRFEGMLSRNSLIVNLGVIPFLSIRSTATSTATFQAARKLEPVCSVGEYMC